MRQLADRDRIERFMQALGDQAGRAARLYFTGGLVDRSKLMDYFEAIEPELYRYPAVDPKTFRRAVHEVAAEGPGS
jgi:hypothetical protein